VALLKTDRGDGTFHTGRHGLDRLDERRATEAEPSGAYFVELVRIVAVYPKESRRRSTSNEVLRYYTSAGRGELASIDRESWDEATDPARAEVAGDGTFVRIARAGHSVEKAEDWDPNNVQFDVALPSTRPEQDDAPTVDQSRHGGEE